MSLTESRSYWWIIIVRMALPPVLTVLLFIIVAFWFVLPTLEENMMASKREMLRELTATVLTQLESYQQEVQEGPSYA